MAYNTPMVQGRFVSDGTPKILSIPSSVDWIEVHNLTAQDQNAADLGIEFYFQRGMVDGRGLIWTKLGTQVNDPVTAGRMAFGDGFFLIDSSDPTQQLSAAVAITNTTNATNPVISTANTSGLRVGSIVRLYNMSTGNGVNGKDFVVDAVVANTSFRLGGVFATAPFANGAATGTYRIVNYEPAFYPPYRYIINITAAAQAVVTLSVPSLYEVGQEVTFQIPEGYGMTEMTGLTGTITAVTNANASPSITVDIDSTAFTAFTFPTLNATGFRAKAIVAPVGIDTAAVLAVGGDILNDAVYNTTIKGVKLMAGTLSPAGQANDIIYWTAGKSFTLYT